MDCKKRKHGELVIYCLSKKEQTASGEGNLSAQSRNLNFILKTVGAIGGL